MRILVRSVLQGNRSFNIVRLHRRRCHSDGVKHRVMSSAQQTGDKQTTAAAVALDKAPENWFSRFSRAHVTPEGCFKGFTDRFNGITVDSSLEGRKEGEEEDIDIEQKLLGTFIDLWPS